MTIPMLPRALLAFALALTAPVTAAAGLTLAERGQPRAVIVLAKSAPRVASFAAAELQAYVRKMCGASLPIVEADAAAASGLPDEARGKILVLVGDSPLARALGLGASPTKDDGFRIRCRGRVLSIVGKDDPEVDPTKHDSLGSAGTLYGAYRFLESLGVRWFFPGEAGEVAPAASAIVAPDDLDVADAPFFPFRLAEPPVGGPEGEVWVRRVGFGACTYPAATCHSFSDWKSRFGRSHPEYLARHGDERLDYICFYAPGVREQMVADARAFFRKTDPVKHPDFTVMENDGAPGACECPQCQRRLTPERGWYGTMSDYVAEAALDVAGAVRQEFPNRGIVLGAYNEYTRPPQRVGQLPDNVGVQLFRHRQHIWSAEARRNVYAAIDQWLALKPKTLSFWDYYDFDCWGGRRWLGGFAVTTRFIAEDIQWLKQRSLRTETRLLGEVIFTDGRVKPWHAQRLWWLAPDLYVTAKCLWNPDLELAPLMRDFYANCFGPAAGPVEKLYRRAEQVWVEGDHGGRNFYCAPDTQPLSKWRQASFINANPWRCLFTPPVLDELSGYLGEAKALAAQPPYRGRVAIIESGLELARQQAAQMK